MTEHSLADPAASADGLAQLQASGVRVVRVLYADLHGIARGKDVPVSVFAGAAEDGLNFCEAIMTVDLRHNVVSGFEHGFQDIVAVPDLSTLVRVPWEPHVATCLADLLRVGTREPYGVDSRGALRRVLAGYAELGLAPVVAPELEFYLCEADAGAPRGFRRYVENDSHVYTVGHRADPRGVLSHMLEASLELGLGAVAANHEFGRSQFEINLRHGPALRSADSAFRFKALVKELAAREGLLATFMGKPWNDDEGSGFHLHMSLTDGDGDDLCADPQGPQGLSQLTRHLIAGLLEHGPALMAFFNPTVNAYRRITPEALVPTRVSWGHDNRLTLVRVPRDRGRATRVELRVGDGTANPYLAYAAALAAGLDGIRRELEPPEPIVGMIYDLPEERQGRVLPASFPEALQALDDDEVIRGAMGEELIETFKSIKAVELERFRAWVTDWEFREYAHHL
jgi:glutamine synthetase